jgi:hypothetical protein
MGRDPERPDRPIHGTSGGVRRKARRERRRREERRVKPSYRRAIALIRKPADHGTVWLARWNPRAEHYDFIMAEPLEHESFRECIDREVGWVLGLDRQRDYLVANMARLNLEFDARLPGHPVETCVNVAFYVVDLYRQPAWQRVDADRQNCWLSAKEICSGRTERGQLVNPALAFLIQRSQVIQPWE